MKLLNYGTVALDIDTNQIIKQATATTNHHQQATT
jgi:hypothetical protein